MRIQRALRPPLVAGRGLLLLSIILAGVAGGCTSDQPVRVPDGAAMSQDWVRAQDRT